MIRSVQSERDKEFVNEMNFQSYLVEVDPEGVNPRSETWNEYLEWNRSDPVDPFSDPHVVFLIEKGDSLAGLIWLALREPFYVFDKPHVWMYNIHVSPDHRRKGVASMLLKQADNWAMDNGRKEIGLQVIDFNEPARKMYEKHGYEFIEQHRSSCFYRKRL